jgi:hypothetical protein
VKDAPEKEIRLGGGKIAMARAYAGATSVLASMPKFGARISGITPRVLERVAIPIASPIGVYPAVGEVALSRIAGRLCVENRIVAELSPTGKLGMKEPPLPEFRLHDAWIVGRHGVTIELPQ